MWEESVVKSVCAYLQGGLGDQCFIYAAARAMALDARARVVLREDRFAGDGYKRQFALDDFHCDYELKSARPKVVRLMHYYYHAFIKKLGRWRLFNTINEKVWFSYHPMPTSWVGRISIDGYWQSEKYFERHAGEIAADFRLKDDSWLKQDKLAQRILADDKSVFLHVRSTRTSHNTRMVPMLCLFPITRKRLHICGRKSRAARFICLAMTCRGLLNVWERLPSKTDSKWFPLSRKRTCCRRENIHHHICETSL